MGRLPYFKFFVGDWLSDTLAMTLEEQGAYVRLLAWSWKRGGPIPADPARRAAILSTTPEREAEVWAALEEFWEETDEGFVNPRLEAERFKAEGVSETASENAKAGWEKRRRNAGADAGASDPQADGISGSTASQKSESESEEKDYDDDWREWLEHYRETTGRTSVRGSGTARGLFNARRSEGYSLADLKLATEGSHGDEFCRSNGFDRPETILRPSKVERYIALGRDSGNDGEAYVS